MTRPTLTSPLLPAALDVLDRADARAAELRALVEASGTTHPTEVLDHALASHLAQAKAPMPVLTNRPADPFDWGWTRPQDESERLAAVVRYQKGAAQQRKRRAWSKPITYLLMGTGAYLIHSGLLAIAHPHSAFATVPFVTWICGWGLMVIPKTIADAVLDAKFSPDKAEKDAQQVTPFGADVDLPSSLEAYLARPTCRAYLRAVLQSGLSMLLYQDVQRLEDLQQQAVRDDQQQAREILRAQEEQAAQARAVLRPQRMILIARALESTP